MNKNTKKTSRAVAYYRVSTKRQGRSGLGLAAQKETVHYYLKNRSTILEREFIEVESGKKTKRPILQQALLYCQAFNTLLIIAKLNRLGRNVAFISALMETKVRFVAVDNPEANTLTLHILAAVAQSEREQISQTTKEALAAAKKRGVKLGKNGKKLAKKNKMAADKFAKKMKPIIERIKGRGYTSIQSITDQLNNAGIRSFRKGSKWHKSTVFNVIKRFSSYSRL